MARPDRPYWRIIHPGIQGKLAYGFGLLLALVAAVALVGLLGLRRVQDSYAAAIDHGLKTERLAEEMKKELLEARQAEKDFLLHWRPDGFAKAHGKYVAANQAHMARIGAIVAELEKSGAPAGEPGGNERIREDLVALKPYLDVYSQDFREAVAIIGAQGSRDGGPDGRLPAEAAAKVEDFHSAAIVVEPLVDDIAAEGSRYAATSIAAAQSAGHRTVIAVGISFIAAILAGMGSSYFLGRRIKIPLVSLARTAEAVGAGDLSVQAQVSTRDEIGTLGNTFNAMTQRLRGLVSTLEQRVLERRQAEEALRASRALLKSIIDNSTAVIYVKDLEGRYLLVNRRYEELFHVTNASIRGKSDLDLFARQRAEDFRVNDLIAVGRGCAVEFEEAVPQDDGLHIYISIKAPLHDEAGRPNAVCGISTDITRLKQMEEQMRQAQKMEAVGRLAGGIAHDFNNLLTAINSYALMAMDGMDSSQPFYPVFRQILQSGQRAGELTRQLLAYSRKQVLAPKLWSLGAIASELEGMLRRLIGEDIDLTVDPGPAGGVARVDRGQVEQIVLNLVVNARDAMPKGGRLRVEVSNVDMDAHHPDTDVPSGKYVMLSVSDSGVGMTPDVKARIFEPFFTTKEVGKGTGLGLSVVYGIVNQSGGYIAVETEPDRGTRFRVYFPRATGATEPAAPEAGKHCPDPGGRGGDETILLVEDELVVREIAGKILESKGYTVLCAAHGTDALRLLREDGKSVRLVITDVVMPDMGGRELWERLAAERPDLPVLFMSGYTHSDRAREGLPEGGHFLQKPFGPTELSGKVREILDAGPARTLRPDLG